MTSISALPRRVISMVPMRNPPGRSQSPIRDRDTVLVGDNISLHRLLRYLPPTDELAHISYNLVGGRVAFVGALSMGIPHRSSASPSAYALRTIWVM
jgi:hypothetical protein